MVSKAIIVSICGLALLQAASGNVSSPRFNTELEEYAVYSAVLKDMHKPLANKSILVVDRSRSPACTDRLLEDHLCDDGRFDTPSGAERCPSTTTLINYIRANAHPRHLNDQFDTQHKHSMLSNDVFENTSRMGVAGGLHSVKSTMMLTASLLFQGLASTAAAPRLWYTLFACTEG